MDPRIRLIIEGVRNTHQPIWYYALHGVIAETDPWCCGCKELVSHKKCPALKAADELEKEYGEESDSD